ncbi:TetR/AcrR family transcriptional regulator [Arthrobacter castelli]|uniref:TetR/AcrR family transcriptional regulator n=1 Tax=Arthrobacter castelli TaxID=271431 RepID=UPI000414EB1A|nr:TetR/AcrR family transcriptional regulator [Arthrobacter castelli]
MMEHMNSRRPARPLSRADIAHAALELIDSAGLDNFSMRKLGTRLEVDAMAIYRRFDDREDLFDEVVAEMHRAVDVAGLPWGDPWPDLVFAYGTALRDALLAHPQAVLLFARRPVRSPDATEWAVRALLKMADEGVPSPAALQAARCVNEFVVGHAIAMSNKEAQAKRSRRPEQGSAGFNVLAAAAASTERGGHFKLGLKSLIDGLQQSLPHHQGS